MSKFIYRMQNVLNIKLSMESQAKMELAAANERVRLEEEKLKALQDKQAHYELRAKELLEEVLNIQDINDNSRMILYVKEEVKAQEKEVAYARRQADRAQDKLSAAMKDRKTHERLKEKAFEQFLLDEKAAESKEIDQLTSFTHGQKVAARGV